MADFRTHPNGYLIAPRRGPAPPCPEGYEQAPGDPYTFLPKIEICEHRGFKAVARACCGSSQRLFCKRREEFTSRQECHKCQVPMPVILD